MRIESGRALILPMIALAVLSACGKDAVLAPESIATDAGNQTRASIAVVEEVCAIVDFESLTHGDAVTVVEVPKLELSFNLTVWPANTGLPTARVYSTDTMAPPGDPFLAWAGSAAACTGCLGLGNVLVVEDGTGFANGGASDFGGTFFLDGFSQADVMVRGLTAVSAAVFDGSHQLWIDAEQVASSAAGNGEVQRLVAPTQPVVGSFLELVILSSAQGGFDELELCRMMEAEDDNGESERGGEGCPVSYWKNEAPTAAWTATGLAPASRLVELLPSLPGELARPEHLQDPADLTFESSLRLRGAGVNRMLREGTAAYLNALSSEVSFDLTTSEVAALIEGAVARGDAKSVAKTLAGYNHQACPLNRVPGGSAK